MEESPIGWLVVGVIVAAIGGALLLDSEHVPGFVAVAVLSVGGLLVQVSIIAVGVEWGFTRREHVRSREENRS